MYKIYTYMYTFFVGVNAKKKSEKEKRVEGKKTQSEGEKQKKEINKIHHLFLLSPPHRPFFPSHRFRCPLPSLINPFSTLLFLQTFFLRFHSLLAAALAKLARPLLKALKPLPADAGPDAREAGAEVAQLHGAHGVGCRVQQRVAEAAQRAERRVLGQRRDVRAGEAFDKFRALLER
jgi:hypothetical protein